MPREYKAYIKDILEAIRKIENYTKNTIKPKSGTALSPFFI